MLPEKELHIARWFKVRLNDVSHGFLADVTHLVVAGVSADSTEASGLSAMLSCQSPKSFQTDQSFKSANQLKVRLSNR